MRRAQLIPKLAVAVMAASLVMVMDVALAANSAVTGTVLRTMMDVNAHGGCMIMLSVSPRDKLPVCGHRWVSFDCLNQLGDTDVVMAYRMMDQAQLALAGNKRVTVKFRDDEISLPDWRFCYAYRIDVIK